MSTQPREDSKESEEYTVLRVHQYDPSKDAAAQKRLIQLGDYTAIQDKKLDLIRSLLVSEGVFDSPDVGSPFCDQKGSELADTTDLKVYFGVLGDDSGESAGYSPVISRQLNVYYKTRKMRTELDDGTKEFLQKQLDLTIKEQKLSEADVQRLKSAFDVTQWAAKAGDKQSHAADLGESQWSVITRTNCLLSGHKMVVHQKKSEKGMTTEMKVERSPYSAFRVKQRDFEPYEISANPEAAGIVSGTATAPATSKLAFRIPRFRVDDDSYVSVYETQNALEYSLAKSSFSETAVEASAGGGFWGVSAAASAGFSDKNENESVTAKSEERKIMNISYKFPRVTVYLDPSSLEITEECKEDVAKVVDKKSLIAFSEKYGDIFAQRVQLGGTLYASEESKAVTGQSKESKSKAMKASAAASFSSAWAQASVSASHSQGGSSAENKTEQDLTNSMAWEATGGDTLLCNNPPEWCATVGDFYNWRVVEQNNILPLYKVLSSFDGLEDIRHRFEASAENKYQGDRWVRFTFKLFDANIGNPLALHKGDKSLYNHLNTEFSKLPTGIKTFDQYREDTLAEVEQSDCSIRCDGSAGGLDVWSTWIHLFRGRNSEIPCYTNLSLRVDDIRSTGLCASKTSTCAGYYDEAYFSLTNYDRSKYFYLEPHGELPNGIKDGSKVYMRTSASSLYLTRTESGLVSLKPWSESIRNEVFVFEVSSIKEAEKQ